MKTQLLTRTALLLALTLAVQAFRFPPAVTGPLVNFMLVLSTLMVGTAGGVLIGSVTPWIALAVGILAAPLAPAVPFIMLGNALLCFLTGLTIRHKLYVRYAGVAAGALLKFAVIGGAASFVLDLPPRLTGALMTPQLINALIGGVIAVSVMAAVGRALQRN